ncbi:MAG: dephospho-CoA kinase [Flavobacteriaceae bacterium]|jgi:dephospho-CoA kinase|nr:dephospho-CoA kinase [Flavobacteriaceae bacterium]RZP06507.1 MAG: dephospho-CoA kinase [Flavobacteriales bacterium]
MKIVGLTGGIGSGKTTVSKEFQKYSIKVYNSDLRAKFLMNNSTVLKKKLINNFGKEFYINDELNKSYISQIIFNDPISIKLINSMVHPEVFNDFNEWRHSLSEKFILYESALIFETGSYKLNDFNILVTCDHDLRVKRIIKRDGINEEKINSIINNQWDDDKKIPLADYIFFNSTSKENKLKVKNLVTYFNSIFK